MIKNWKYILAVGASFTFSAAFSQSVQDAKRATDFERYDEATKTLRKLGTDEATFFLGDAYLKAGKPDSAAIAYNQGYAANQKSPISMVGAGKAALLKNNAGEAERLFESAVKATKSKDPEILRLIGQAYADAKVTNITKAKEYMDEALKRAKDNKAPIYVTLGDLNLADPNGGGAAMSAYDQAVAADKNFAKAHLRRGQLFVRSRNYNEAEQAFKAALAIDPNYAPAYRELGEMYYFVGKYDQSLENYRKYVSMSENTPGTRAKYASFLFLTKDYAGTQKEAQEVLAKDPKNVVMNRLLAYSLFETGKTAEAQAAMENYFKNAKQEEIIGSDYAYYGRILAKTGNNELAQTNFDKALQLDPDNIDLQDDIAAFYVKQKQYPKAIAIYKAKLAAKPSNVDNVKLADVYFASKQLDAADSLFAVVLKTNPTYVHGIFRRAQIADEKDTDKTGDAKPLFEEFIKTVNQDPTKAESYKSYLIPANFMLGYYAYLGKDYTTAKKYWEETKRLDPTHKEATDGLKNISIMANRKK
jgi:tetratricopeptide (TPR) repeat protein